MIPYFLDNPDSTTLFLPSSTIRGKSCHRLILLYRKWCDKYARTLSKEKPMFWCNYLSGSWVGRTKITRRKSETQMHDKYEPELNNNYIFCNVSSWGKYLGISHYGQFQNFAIKSRFTTWKRLASQVKHLSCLASQKSGIKSMWQSLLGEFWIKMMGGGMLPQDDLKPVKLCLFLATKELFRFWLQFLMYFLAHIPALSCFLSNTATCWFSLRTATIYNWLPHE